MIERAQAGSLARSGVGAVVLAAGAARRFGTAKQLAPLDGRPMLQHVLDLLSGLRPLVTIVIVPPATALDGITWRDELRIPNPDPARGLSSSLQLGVDAAADRPDLQAVLVVLGDQPRTSGAVIEQLVEALRPASRAGAIAVVPSYARGGGGNPVLLLRRGFPFVHEARGDRGLGRLLTDRPDLAHRVEVPGDNPDVDTPEELRALQGAG